MKQMPSLTHLQVTFTTLIYFKEWTIAYRLLFAIKNKENIGIFGDFDTDGLTGTAVLARGLANLGASVHPYIPHRTLEGHGISDESIDFFKKNEVSLLITVDCGVTSFNEINTAKKLGIETIVTDHHVPDDTLPDAVSIINPSLPTCLLYTSPSPRD